MYAVFISYPRSTDEDTKSNRFMSWFVDCLNRNLRDQINTYTSAKTFYDEGGIAPGSKLDSTLGCALCESLFMVLVYTPRFEESEYCQRELETMEQLESERLKELSFRTSVSGLIIPILLRIDKSIPQRLSHRKYYDLSNILTMDAGQWKSKTVGKKLDEIAKQISSCFKVWRTSATTDFSERCKSHPLRAVHQLSTPPAFSPEPPR